MIGRYKRPPILDSIPSDRHAVIEASAGTGKTFTIEHLVVEILLQKNVDIKPILVLTFTERAATELRTRIRRKIEEVLITADQGEALRGPRTSHFWWINGDGRERLTHALEYFDMASIGTIHGFFGRILVDYAFASGRPLGGTLEDGRTLFGLGFKQALRRSLSRGSSAELLTSWLDQSASPNAVVELERLLWRCHSSHRRILPDFSLEELYRQLELNKLINIDIDAETERFMKAVKAAGITHGSTTKAIKNRLERISEAIDRSSGSAATLLDPSFLEAIDFLDQKLDGRRLTDPLAAELAEAVASLRTILVSLDAALVQTSLPVVRDFIDRHKSMTGAFDFDDLIEGVGRALDDPEQGPTLIASIRHRYRYALVDEFQDTDERQWSFFKRVFVDSSGENTLYVIGDPKQAIYGFRGADVHTYLQASNHLARLNHPRVPLTHNFRSTPSMIDAYNRILNPRVGSSFFDPDGDIRYPEPVIAGAELIACEADGSPAIPIHLFEVRPLHEGKLSVAELRRGLARRIAREILTLRSTNGALSFGKFDQLRSIDDGEIFILTAKNSEAREVADSLREASVPFSFYKQEGLFQTSEAREVRDLLAAVEDPADRRRRARAWITPFFAVPLAALESLTELPDGHPIVRRLVDWNALAKERRFENLFTRILDESGVLRRELFLEDNERALTNYSHLFELLLEKTRTTGCDLSNLVRDLTSYIKGSSEPPGEDGDVQRLESERSSVQIMTIHKSKGLEAAVVFLYGGWTGPRPDDLYAYHDEGERVLYIGKDQTAAAAAEKERAQEDQRLFYVALTRAKARLYLPLIRGDLWGDSWKGGYRHVNDRLLDVVNSLSDPENDNLFKIVPFQDEPVTREKAAIDGAGPTLGSWNPNASLQQEPENSSNFDRLKRSHAGYLVTSYSGMKQSWNTGIDPLTPDELSREPGSPSDLISTTDELPGGTATGSMLHAILEHVPFQSVATARSLDEWRDAASIAEIVTRAMNENGIDHKHGAQVAAMTFRALTLTIPAGPGVEIPGLCHCGQVIREMEFLFPFPETFHPTLAEAEPDRLKKLVVDRGFIKGFIDLVVEHEGKIYFADWKSDTLATYDAQSLEDCVRDHYELQVKLYSLAMVKALAIRSESEYERSFGGLFYIFLRGLQEDDATSPGLYWKRPTWSQVVEYEKEIRGFKQESRRGSR
jgi:exodeoxyribonuclease V beta subunit